MSTLTLPPGDPVQLEAAARALTSLGGPLATALGTARTEAVAIAAGWHGPAGDVARSGVEALASSLAPAAPATEAAAAAVRHYAQALRSAQQGVRRLERTLDAAEADAHRLLRAADELRSAAVRAELAEARRAVERAHAHLLDDLAGAARAAASGLREAAAAFGPVRGESPSSLADRVREQLLVRLPVLREHPEWVRSAVWAAGSGLPGTPGPVWRAVQWQRAWSAAAAGVPLGGTALHAPTAANSPLVQRLVRSALGEAGLRVLTHPVVAGTAPAGSLLRGPLATLPARAGVVRGLGVAGGVAAVGLAVLDVVAQGNPVEAFERHGAEYVADLTRTAFDVSATALMVAPSPWTAGAVAITGLAYGASELVAHWDDVERLWSDTGEVAGSLLDSAASLGSRLNPFD